MIRSPRAVPRLSSPYARLALRRIAFIPIGVFVVVTLSFLLVNLIPSNPARAIDGGLATPGQIRALNHQLGVDAPLWTRYERYLTSLMHGNLGHSFYTGRSVASDIGQYLPSTVELVLLALVVAAVVGISLGLASAKWSGGAADKSSRSVVGVMQSVPDFYLGIILIFVVFYLLSWAPAPIGQLGILDTPPPRVTGMYAVDSLIAGNWGLFDSVMSHALLPVLTLGLANAPFFAKITRVTVGEAMHSDYVEFGRACGLPERTLLRYAFHAGRVPILTYGLMLLATLIGGAAIVETIYAWNGIGQWAVTGILKVDIPQVQGFILVSGLITLFVFLVLDLLTLRLDPRIRRV